MDIKNWIIARKYQIMLIMLMILASFIIGCTSGNGNVPPPTGPIGGGCGG